MEIIHDNTKFQGSTSVTIGVFDGVHSGHQKLLEQLSADAKSKNLKSALVTFDCHPLSVIAPGHSPKMLMTLDRKLELIEQTGLVDVVLVVDFNAIRAAQSAEDFVKEVLVEQLGSKSILIGENFQFGHGRRGNFAMLKELSVNFGYEVERVTLLTNESESPVSSTLIRQYISVGNVQKAKELLTRPHELVGTVVPGDQVGNELGYPTANTQVDESMSIPADGVYSGRAILENGSVYKSAISIGVRPMFHDDNIRVIEPHLLDFDEVIYGQQLKIEFEEKLREQLVLPSVEDLISQIDEDVETVRATVQAG